MSHRQLAAAFAVLTLLGSSCGRDPDVVVSQQGGARPDDPRAVAGPPFDVGARTAIAGVEGTVVAFNGVSATDDEGVGETAVFESSTGAWRSAAQSPFAHALYGPAAVGVAGDVVVAGLTCDDIADGGSSLPVCKPGTIDVALYDVVEDTWTALPAPPLDFVGAPLSFVETLGDDVVLGIANRVFVLDISASKWSELPPPPFLYQQLCVVGDEVVVADMLESAPDDAPDAASGRARYAPVIASSFDASSGTWTGTLPIGDTYQEMTNFSFACTPDGVVALPYTQATLDGASTSVYVFAPHQGWTSQKTPPGIDPLGAVMAYDTSGDDTVVLTTAAEILMRPDGLPWRIRPVKDQNGIGVAAIGSDAAIVLVNAPDREKRGFVQVNFS